MKHLYTLALALAVGLGAQAREFTFYQGDTPVEPNSTIYYSDMKTTDIGGGYREVVIDPSLSVSSDIFTNTASVTVTCREGVTVQMCAGGLCEAGATVTKSPLTLQTGQKLSLDFEYMAELGPDEQIPTLTVDVEAKDTRYTNVSTKFTIVMGPNASSLTDIEASKNSIAYSGGSLRYSLAAPSAVSLYSITGTQVLAFHAEGEGSVNTHSLLPGVYIYSIKNASGRSTGKIFVRR